MFAPIICSRQLPYICSAARLKEHRPDPVLPALDDREPGDRSRPGARSSASGQPASLAGAADVL